VRTGQVVALVALGVFHGLNPAMGWLFAVSMGLQERRRTALLLALPPIALGHEASVTLFAAALALTGSLLSGRVIVLGTAGLLVTFGLWRLVSRRHLRWAGMRLRPRQLAAWSFVTSAAHGAGLMVLPVLLLPGGGPGPVTSPARGVGVAVLAGAVHTAAMLTVTAAVALLVYEVLGLGVLRRLWVDVDRVWAVALVGAGVATVLLAG